jgi:hypothetical protein
MVEEKMYKKMRSDGSGSQRLESFNILMSSLPIEEQGVRVEVFTVATMKNKVC